MRVEQLKFFIELVTRRSFHVAAERLGITQQALSASVKSLENEFGITLVSRHRNGCTLTADGELFLNYAQKSLDDYERMALYFSTRNGAGKYNSQNHIDIVFLSSFLSTCSSAAINEFSKRFPKVKINIRMVSEQKVQEYTKSGSSNYLIFQTIPFDSDGRPFKSFMPEGVNVHLIKKSYYMGCVSKKSMLAGLKEASLMTLLDFPMVLSIEARQSTTPIHSLLNRYKPTNVILTTPSFFTWSQAIADNIGIGFIQELFLESEHIRKIVDESTRCIRLHEGIGAYLGVTLPPTPNEAARSFFGMMKNSGTGAYAFTDEE